MMGHRGEMKGGEHKALTPFGKKYHKHRPGERKYWKNRYIKRSRHQSYSIEHHLEESKHNDYMDFVVISV
jgi:hypothetical protein